MSIANVHFSGHLDTDNPAATATSPTLATAGRLLVEHLGATPTGLQSFGVRAEDRDRLAAHLGRVVLQACPGRDFRKAWYTDNDGNRVPRYYRLGTKSLARCQYAMLTHKQYAAVVVVDVDRPGAAGGTIEDLDSEVRRALSLLTSAGRGPAWVGINPLSGKCQLVWLIDPVHADGSGDSSNMRLMQATTRILGDAVGGDPAFAHSLSRSPFYTGDDPTAYRWQVLLQSGAGGVQTSIEKRVHNSVALIFQAPAKALDTITASAFGHPKANTLP